MKKQLLISLFSMLMIFLSNTIVKAESVTDSFSKTLIGTYHYVDSSGKYGDFEYFKRKSDGQIAYCIEPGVSLSNNIYNGLFGTSLNDMANFVSLSEAQLNMVSLYAHFGWGYDNHYGNEWIVATQALIWQELGRDFQFTSRNSKADPWKYIIDIPTQIQSNMNEIKRLTNIYLSKPAFNTTYAKISINSSYTFTDSLNTLGNYSISNCTNCKAEIQGNNLVVTPTNAQGGKISLEKSDGTWASQFIVYYRGDGQNMLVPGMVDPIKLSISYDVVSGSLNLTKYDEDTKSCNSKYSGGELAGSIYKLYKSDGTYIQDLVIDSNCNSLASNLELGSYYVQEYQAGKNYQIDSNKYYFDITIENPSISLTVFDKMFLGQIEVYKYDNKTNSCKSISKEASLVGAIYGIYRKSDNTLLEKLIIDENCHAISERKYILGDYYIKEIEAPKGYKIDNNIYKISVTKENADNVITQIVKEEVYETNLIINKNYLVENGVKAEVGAEFEIYLNSTNEKYGTLVIDESGYGSLILPYGRYTIKQTKGKDNYHLSDNIQIYVDENVNKNTYISILNKPYSAHLKLIKVDEDGNKITQSGIKFKIFDVINNKYICQSVTYPTSKVICEFETDENGEFITPEVLFPSAYRIEEVNQYIENYLWNSNSLEFVIDKDSNFEVENEKKLIIKEFANQSVIGKINVIKYGEKYNFINNNIIYEKVPLSNIIFGLYKNGNLLYTSVTDNNGYAYFDNLELGQYVLKELETLDGYILDETEYIIDLRYKDQYTSIVEFNIDLVNYYSKGILEFTKTDLVSGKVIPNTKINIYDISDELIFSGLTDSEGKIIIDNLPIGKYYIMEEEPATGYVLTEEKIYFEILENGEVIKANMTNKSIPVPDTGKSDKLLITSIILCLTGAGIIIYEKKKK